MTPVRLEKADGIAIVTIDNPPVNALGQAVREGLVACIDAADRDDEVEAVILTGTGDMFSAGADIREFGRPPEVPPLPEVVERIEASPKPVVAACRGNALGGGLELALGCHYRVAARGATLGLPEVRLGLLPGATGTQRLPRLVGVEAALDIMLGGKPLGAVDAEALGLVDEVSDDTELMNRAAAFARAHVTDSPRRLRNQPVPAFDEGIFEAVRDRIAPKTRGLLSPEKIIRSVEAATRMSYEEGCAFEREAFVECKASPQSDGLRHAFFAEREAAKVPGIDRSAPIRSIDRLAVLGAGTMGTGIAYAALTSGLTVHLLDNDKQGLARGQEAIDGYYAYAVERGKIDDDDADAGRSRLTTGTDYAAIADADLVIEAVFESMAVKKDVFTKLDAVCRDGAILATNTSTLDVDAIASVTGRPADVIGLHFFSPAHIMRLLEIVRGDRTAIDVVATALAFAKRLGKLGVVVRNCFGFVGNRMLYSYGRENQLMLLEGAPPEYIDRTLCDWGMAMGPNAVGDLAGLDVGYKARREREDLPDDPRFYRVADLLVEQGRYGIKTGRGMYLYEEGSRTPVPDPDVRAMISAEAGRLGVAQRQITGDEIVERCVYGLVTEGARILEEGIALRASDIDAIWINGYGFPRHRGGPMHYADRVGLERVYARVRDFAERFGEQYWQPPALLRELAGAGSTFGAWRRATGND